jgi:hypothetical protein
LPRPSVHSQAEQLNPSDAAATPIVARINDLFAIDAEARAQEMDWAGRDELLQNRTKP